MSARARKPEPAGAVVIEVMTLPPPMVLIRLTMSEAARWQVPEDTHPGNLLPCPLIEIVLYSDTTPGELGPMSEPLIESVADLWARILLADLQRRPPCAVEPKNDLASQSGSGIELGSRRSAT